VGDLAGEVPPSVVVVPRLAVEVPGEAEVQVAGEVVHQLDHFVRGDRGRADLQGEESHLEVALLSASLSVEENRIAVQEENLVELFVADNLTATSPTDLVTSPQ